MIKEAQRNPYKCMNVMKQDAMDDKIIEGCKKCEKTNLSTRKMLSTRIPKHTHTLNKSNQFYISKTSQDSLVSIH